MESCCVKFQVWDKLINPFGSSLSLQASDAMCTTWQGEFLAIIVLFLQRWRYPLQSSSKTQSANLHACEYSSQRPLEC